MQHIHFTKEELNKLFSTIPRKIPGRLDLDEFRSFFLSAEANSVFEKMLANLRENDSASHEKRRFIPFNMYHFFKHILLKTQNRSFRERINSSNFRKAKEDLESYKSLFSIKSRSQRSLNTSNDSGVNRSFSRESQNRSSLITSETR
jgi:hypothetical protein